MRPGTAPGGFTRNPVIGVPSRLAEADLLHGRQLDPGQPCVVLPRQLPRALALEGEDLRRLPGRRLQDRDPVPGADVERGDLAPARGQALHLATGDAHARDVLVAVVLDQKIERTAVARPVRLHRRCGRGSA